MSPPAALSVKEEKLPEMSQEEASLRARYAEPTVSIGHSGMTVARFQITHLFGTLFPLTAGLIMFGWRAGLTVLAVGLPALATLLVWRRVGHRGRQLRYAHLAWFAILLALLLPAHLATRIMVGNQTEWPLLPLAGILLVIFCWLLSGLGAGRIHPVVATYLVLMFLYAPMMVPHRLLQRNSVVLGDLANTEPRSNYIAPDAWLRRPLIHNHDSLSANPSSEYLASYTTGTISPERAWLSLEGLLRDRLPPLEDLILGAQPGPIGTSSAIAVIIGGLFLLYRGLIDYRIPLLIVITAFTAFMILPIPWRITEYPEWRWAPFHVRGVGWSAAITFANYELLASPLLFTAFYLATAPSVRPLTRRGRNVFSLTIGLLAAIFQLYCSVAYGCFLALLIASLITPALDRVFKPRPLV